MVPLARVVITQVARAIQKPDDFFHLGAGKRMGTRSAWYDPEPAP